MPPRCRVGRVGARGLRMTRTSIPVQYHCERSICIVTSQSHLLRQPKSPLVLQLHQVAACPYCKMRPDLALAPFCPKNRLPGRERLLLKAPIAAPTPYLRSRESTVNGLTHSRNIPLLRFALEQICDYVGKLTFSGSLASLLRFLDQSIF